MDGNLLTMMIGAGFAILVTIAWIVGRIDAQAQRRALRRLAAARRN